MVPKNGARTNSKHRDATGRIPEVSTILLRMPDSDDPRRHGPNNPEDTPASSLTGPLGNLKVGALSYMVGVWIPREKNLRAKKIDRLADTGHG